MCSCWRRADDALHFTSLSFAELHATGRTAGSLEVDSEGSAAICVPDSGSAAAVAAVMTASAPAAPPPPGAGGLSRPSIVAVAVGGAAAGAVLLTAVLLAAAYFALRARAPGSAYSKQALLSAHAPSVRGPPCRPAPRTSSGCSMACALHQPARQRLMLQRQPSGCWKGQRNGSWGGAVSSVPSAPACYRVPSLQASPGKLTHGAGAGAPV